MSDDEFPKMNWWQTALFVVAITIAALIFIFSPPII